MTHQVRFEKVSKSYAGGVVLDDVSFTARPGAVTGFVGRNGAGKTTALRVLLQLAHATSGRATIGGRQAGALPVGTIGHLLDAGFHPGRSGRDHLRIVGAVLGVEGAEVEEALASVDLRAAASKAVRSYSLGMRQRLGLAAALLGRPQVLILDEPTNGLDPDGVFWLRAELRRRADEGAVVLVSSHMLLELEQVVDDLVVLDRKVRWQGTRQEALRVSPDSSLEGLYRSLSAQVAA